MVHGDPTAVANVTRHPFNLKSGEVPLFFFGSVVYSKETVSRGRDSANAKAEVFTVLEANPHGGNPVTGRPVFGWFLFNMAHALAQPEAMARYTH